MLPLGATVNMDGLALYRDYLRGSVKWHHRQPWKGSCGLVSSLASCRNVISPPWGLFVCFSFLFVIQNFEKEDRDFAIAVNTKCNVTKKLTVLINILFSLNHGMTTLHQTSPQRLFLSARDNHNGLCKTVMKEGVRHFNVHWSSWSKLAPITPELFMVSVTSTLLAGVLVNCKNPLPNSLSGFLKVMSHETIRNNDFLRNTELQHCYD